MLDRGQSCWTVLLDTGFPRAGPIDLGLVRVGWGEPTSVVPTGTEAWDEPHALG